MSEEPRYLQVAAEAEQADSPRTAALLYSRAAMEKVFDEATDPGDDVNSGILFVHEDGTFFPISLDMHFFANDDTKDLLIQKIVEIIETEEARRKLPNRLSEHPDAREGIVITGIDADGIDGAMAVLNRHEDQPPTLDDWKDDDLQMFGRFDIPIREAFVKAKRAREEADN